MHLLLLALAIGIFAHDGLVPPAEDAPAPLLAGPWLLAAVVLPKVALAGAYWLACVLTKARLGKPGGTARLRWLDRFTGGLTYAALALYALDLFLGWLRFIRGADRNVVLLDEVAAMAPTLAVLVFAWWAYYPIDRRIREASLIAHFDSGRPIYPIWTRSQYLIAQLRHQVAIIFLPLVLIMGWSEFVQGRDPVSWGPVPLDLRPLLIVAGSAAVFLVAPVVMRHLWDTAPLPEGELRSRLVELCRRHRVRVREVLLWRTFGGLINAAVMGLLPPVRYILLTDALLDSLDRREVEAVMAHELAHVKKRHMFWLLGAAIASLGLLELGVNLLVEAIPHVEGEPESTLQAGWLVYELFVAPEVTWGLGMLAAALGWVLVFGWVSRRIERQADAFAVQSIADERAERARLTGGASGGPTVIDGESAAAMIAALQRVAELNHIPVHRGSWRHGSIAWRQAYLRTLVGQRVGGVSIDRQMRWVQLATLLGLAALIAAASLMPAAGPAGVTLGL